MAAAAAAAAEKSKILIVGGTGYIGKFIVEASARLGHPTFVLVRESTASSSAKAPIIHAFKSSGVTILYGDLYDHGSLVKAIKQVDVVISTVGQMQLADQTMIIAAIKEAGNVKICRISRVKIESVAVAFPFTSCRGSFHRILGMMWIVYMPWSRQRHFSIKSSIRRNVEAEGIPYTYVSSNSFAGYSLPTLGQAGSTGLPTEKVTILGEGNSKAISVHEEDIATYTIRAVDDPRTLNKILYLRPPGNIYSQKELVSLLEKKIGKTLKRVFVPEEEVLKQIQESAAESSAESPIPLNLTLSIQHSVFVKGDHTNFEIEPSIGVEASELYPDVKYTTVDEYLDRLLV